MLRGELVDFSSLHFLELAIDDGSQTVRMDMMGAVVSRLGAGSVLPPFDSSTPAGRDDSFSAAEVSRCCWSC